MTDIENQAVKRLDVGLKTTKGITVERICVSAGHNFFGHAKGEPGSYPTLEVQKAECVAGRGLRGDRFFDYKPNYKGQMTLFSTEVFDALRTALGIVNADPSASRRNVFVRGIDLNQLIGAEFELQGLLFEGVEECRPCDWMNLAFGAGAEEWLRDRGGLRARILRGGVLHCDSRQ